MATNTTLKKAAPDADTTAAEATEAAESARRIPAVVGPPLGVGDDPVSITLSHHLRIDGADYVPGAQVKVSPDYARRLRAQGFIART
ncbi:hypothetical protein [Streptomyces similanensis]|uniref:Uncharacterized protein n=1 Tax=Streptomyces similanensis TaxID=1274988 RepID=A0ABP9L868_9ACTN